VFWIFHTEVDLSGEDIMTLTVKIGYITGKMLEMYKQCINRVLLNVVFRCVCYHTVFLPT